MRLRRSFALVITISLLTATSWAFVAQGKANLKVRQPLKVAAMAKNGIAGEIRQRLATAVASADRLDRQIPDYLRVSSLGVLQRWKRGVDLSTLERQYTQDLASHIIAMTDLLRSRREQRGFKKWQEFEFKNLLAKSDYILAVPMSRQSLIAQRNSLDTQRMLLEYNRERLYFDGQKIAL